MYIFKLQELKAFISHIYIYTKSNLDRKIFIDRNIERKAREECKLEQQYMLYERGQKIEQQSVFYGKKEII